MTVVDLDGTLLAGNSFRWFTRFVLRLAACRAPLQMIALCGLIALRKLRLCSHRRLKWELMKTADRVLTPEDYNRFARIMQGRINRSVLSMLPSDTEPVVASAASAEYVAPFVELMGWKHFVATRRPDSGRFRDFTECRGESKVKAVRTLFPGNRIEAVLTDHVDDLPLLLASSGRRILVNPSATTLLTVKGAGLAPEILST